MPKRLKNQKLSLSQPFFFERIEGAGPDRRPHVAVVEVDPETSIHEVLAGGGDAAGHWPWLAARLRLYLGELDLHHNVEDVHYFPLFRSWDARLGRGFDILDGDHRQIHAMIALLASTAQDLHLAVQTKADGRGPLERLAARWEDLTTALGRHLDDEEDLVLPLLLDHGDPEAGDGR